jgi:AcrR family transcriptional regulator
MLSAPNNHAKEVASMRTRERILETALRLFNEQGTAAVSTNHIAEALEISPGNLYYHFRNKEEIVRALVDRLFARTGSELNLPADRPPTPDDLQDLVRINFAILWDYRFVYRELLALLQRDDALRQLYTTVRARGFADMHQRRGQWAFCRHGADGTRGAAAAARAATLFKQPLATSFSHSPKRCLRLRRLLVSLTAKD